MKMNPKKAFFVMLIVLAGTIAIGAAGFYFGDKILTEKASDISDAKADQQLVERQLEIYEDSKRKVEEFSSVVKLADKVLPKSKKQAEAVAEIRKFASSSGIGIQQISFASGDAAVAADPNLSQTAALANVPGVRVLTASVVLQQGVSYQRFLGFLGKIERNLRKMQVTSVSITPDALNRNNLSNASLDINIFLRG